MLKDQTLPGPFIPEATFRSEARVHCQLRRVDASKVVSQLTNRHLPLDSRCSIEEEFQLIESEQWDPYMVSRDMWGEKQIAILANILKEKGILFEDPTFPENSTSRYISPCDSNSSDTEQSDRKDLDPFLTGVKGIEWKRPFEIGDERPWMPIFVGYKDHSGQKTGCKEIWPMIFEKV